MAFSRSRPSMPNDFKSQFLRADRDTEKMTNLLNAELSANRDRGDYDLGKTILDEVVIDVPAFWYAKPEQNLRVLLSWHDGLYKLHDDHLFAVKTIAGELEFSKRTTAADLWEYAERIAAAVSASPSKSLS